MDMYDYSTKRADEALRRLCGMMAEHDSIDVESLTGMQFRVDPVDYKIEKMRQILKKYHPLINRESEPIKPQAPAVSFEELYKHG